MDAGPAKGERPRTVKRVSAYLGSARRESAVTIHDVIAIDDRREGLAVGIRAEAMPPLLLDDRPGGTESVQLDRSGLGHMRTRTKRRGGAH